MALYPKATQRLIAPGSNDPRITPNVAVLHVDAGNASTLYGWFTNPDAGGVESHFHITKAGVVEQYRDTNYQCDAQRGGATDGVSIETQGYGSGEWTTAQLEAIKALLLWLVRVHPAMRLRVPRTPTDAGVGYHSLFPSDVPDTWARDGRTCPGPDRIRQYRTILVPWMANPEGDDMPTTDEIADEILGRPVKDLEGNVHALGTALGITFRNSTAATLAARDAARDAAVARALAEAAAQAPGALTPEDVSGIVAATVAGVDAHLDARDRALAEALAGAEVAP